MFYFGVDYYPEHWPETRWPEDARLMAEAGFNVVRLGEFAWSRLEPDQGHFNFTWLDRAIDLLRLWYEHPPRHPDSVTAPWLMADHPELFLVRQDGRQATFGHRREYCPNQPLYHNYVRNIVETMTKHYSGHPAVIGWQIDNEFGDRCYCPCCAGAFHSWLRRRYSTLDVLNERWGTTFWSHIYTAWDQIPVPLTTGGSPNPGLALDFYRFCSDSYVAFQQIQIDILRQACPDHLITHNFMGFQYDLINLFDLARPLDLVTWDNYPRMQWNIDEALDPSQAALGHDTMRGLKQRPFWVMEQQAGPGGWEIVSPAPRPGQLRLWAYQAIAHGADGVLFFRWRTARTGTEQYWHGLLEHHGQPGRRYDEIKRMGVEMQQVGEHLHGTRVEPAVAMLLSYDTRFAFQIQANNPKFSYPGHFQQVYSSMYRRQVPVDVVAPTADLSGYKLVFAPALHLVSTAIAENLERYVRAGGLLIITARSGVKDDGNTVVDQPLPGLLSKMCGVEVEEYDSLAPGMHNTVEFIHPELAHLEPLEVSTWCDMLRPLSAIVIARYTQDFYAGHPAITLNHFGDGKVMYVGFLGEASAYEEMADWLLDLAHVTPLLHAPPGVEVLDRLYEGQRLKFVLNHTDQEQSVTLDSHYLDLLNGSSNLEGIVRLGAHDVLVLQRR